MEFSTRDRDNDRSYGYSCAAASGSGWWYNLCFAANLNGHPGSWLFDLEWDKIDHSVMMITKTSA